MAEVGDLGDIKVTRIAVRGATEVDHVEVLRVSSGKGRKHWSMIQETLKVPRITTYRLLGDEFLEVLQVDTTKTWITPYKCYLADGLLSDEPIDKCLISIIFHIKI